MPLQIQMSTGDCEVRQNTVPYSNPIPIRLLRWLVLHLPYHLHIFPWSLLIINRCHLPIPYPHPLTTLLLYSGFIQVYGRLALSIKQYFCRCSSTSEYSRFAIRPFWSSQYISLKGIFLSSLSTLLYLLCIFAFVAIIVIIFRVISQLVYRKVYLTSISGSQSILYSYKRIVW